ncbi:PTS system, mannitol-specific IIC subunit [Alkaliphilus metalliredigens QYMF]|uniref:Mannitol-specific phosphotransferase enzyme IIA component n=1 Tax=Alkaliphilus metalliredigens (strain QYMF) TaxID=293826 RepID=A6TVX9_ALKMQ|nr:PTS mannitol transporter subunit IICBA [Alkaliphilus metalliredigens]ABR50347.1 PTS system, mannitol-specific IIC subunit [Alkaliphilus metalliredigens QYMF]
MNVDTVTKENHVNKSTQERIQGFGRFLSGMVMPNIGAFIAWGLITALFIPTGWIPNENLSELVGPMIIYLLPLLIGYTGGKMVGGIRGGVIGAVATMGVIVGVDIPMFIGAMLMGPIGGYAIKKFDEAVEGKVPAGFEMLVNNFSAGIIGTLVALLAYLAIGPVVQGLNDVLKTGVEAMVNAGFLPLSSLLIEPGKILFLNNAMNHGVLGPLGMQEASSLGKSIFFLLETNPGPGLGILLAYWTFAKGMVKQSAPGAIIIHFLGGIHEIYFPYVLMNPILLVAVMAGGASGVLTFSILGAGLVATPSPGSIFALMAMTPRGGYFVVLAGVIVSTTVSFLIAAYFIKRSNNKLDEGEFTEAKEKVAEFKGKKSTLIVSKIIFACDAGMGSSAMAATGLRSKLKEMGLNIQVVNIPVNEIPHDAELVITHEGLTNRAKGMAPNAEHISIKDYFNDPEIDRLMTRLQSKTDLSNIVEVSEVEENKILRKSNIKLNLKSMEKDEAIKMVGQLLVDSGYVDAGYIDAMLEREAQLSTYIGKGVAIPHGVGAAKSKIKKSGMAVLQFPEGISFGEETVYILIGIAGAGNEHLSILSNIACAFEDDDDVEMLKSTKNVDEIYHKFTVEAI